MRQTLMGLSTHARVLLLVGVPVVAVGGPLVLGSRRGQWALTVVALSFQAVAASAWSLFDWNLTERDQLREMRRVRVRCPRCGRDVSDAVDECPRCTTSA